jgi:uncharacterized RDD family membrane protein YckC
VLFSKSSLLTGVDASAAQNSSVTKTCSQCGAVLPSSVRACNFCDSSFSVGPSAWEDPSDISARENLAAHTDPGSDRNDQSNRGPVVSQQEAEQGTAWRGELARRLDAYRSRRRKLAPNAAQSQFSFDDSAGKPAPDTSVVVAEKAASLEDDFSFTIAIGRPAKKRVPEESRMVIDVSLPPDSESNAQTHIAEDQRKSQPGLHPVASMDDRRLSALVDFFCLLFAYGGFLMLFGSLGGQFTLSKLSAAVYTTTFAIVYLQYFALFTIFGGTTPGMMMRGLQVVSFSGEPPTPRQMLLRSAGYVLSAGTFFLGFLWAMWDEDELTWHDRLSHTHLSTAQTFADLENSSVAHSQ